MIRFHFCKVQNQVGRISGGRVGIVGSFGAEGDSDCKGQQDLWDTGGGLFLNLEADYTDVFIL